MCSPLPFVSTSPPPARSAADVHAAAEQVVATARRLAALRRRVQSPDDGARAHHPRVPVTLRVHPALSGPGADPAEQGWQLAQEAAGRIRRAGRDWLAEDLATVVEDVFGIDVAVVATPVWFDGAAWREQHARIAVVGATGWPGRQRFALAHQVGHLLVAGPDSLHIDASIEQAPPERAHPETRANAFADAFLMPRDVLLEIAPHRWDPAGFASLASWLQLPARAVARRLHQLGLLPPADRRRLETLRGAEVAALARTTDEYTSRCRQAAQPRPPTRLLHHAAPLDPPAGTDG